MTQVEGALWRKRPFAAQQMGDVPVQTVFETIRELRVNTGAVYPRLRKLHGRVERQLLREQQRVAWWERQRAEEVAQLKACWLPGAPIATKERGGVPTERGGVWEEERVRYDALDPEGLFFRRAMGLEEDEEERDGGPGGLMDLP